MLFIYDINGFIAGMQSIVPKAATFNDTYYNFSSTKFYQLELLNGTEVNIK